MKTRFLNDTLKGTKLYIAVTLLLSMIYSRLIVEMPMFIQYVLDGVIIGNESVIPEIMFLGRYVKVPEDNKKIVLFK